MRKLVVMLLALSPAALAQERKVEPTWLYRDVSAIHEHATDFSSAACHYVPIFGEGDPEAKLPRSVARFGQLTIDPHGECPSVSYPRQEELFFVLEGSGTLHYGDEVHPIATNDFTYIAPSLVHSVSNTSDHPFKLVVSTIKISVEKQLSHPPKLPDVANLNELQEQTVGGHPTSVLYKLLIGPRTSKRDRINAGYQLTDFFVMDFAPGGTNFPHHHEISEEIYLVLDGKGKMAAGGGMDGVEGLHSAKAGDAYYFRTNCTVGFYNENTPGAKAHILALRVYVPMPKNDE
jgi:mannose-6-phosphate isomerase-like protein (cupin superfamily)